MPAPFIPLQEPDKPVRITITLPTNAYFMSGVRDFTLSFIKNVTAFDEKWAYRFQSVVDELCNNAIEFGSAPGQDIKLTLVYYPKENMEIIVEDTGTGKSKITAEELAAKVEEQRKPGYVNTGIRGRGLSKIVAEWTDELHFENKDGGGIRAIGRKKLGQQQAQTPGVAFEAKPGTLVLQ